MAIALSALQRYTRNVEWAHWECTNLYTHYTTKATEVIYKTKKKKNSKNEKRKQALVVNRRYVRERGGKKV